VVSGDQVLLQQVLVNLVMNAMDAMAEIPPIHRRLTITSGVRAGEVAISVRDRGIGLPTPIRLDIDQPALGGDVRATFSHGVARGHVTEWRPRHALAYSIDGYDIDDLPFHITRLGRGPHYGLATERVDNWLTLEGTRYDLTATPAGGTRLRRSVSWRRHLAPGFYFGWLQDQIMARGQHRLLELIRARLAEPGGLRARGDAPAVASLPGL